jgi:hypothetical protein
MRWRDDTSGEYVRMYIEAAVGYSKLLARYWHSTGKTTYSPNICLERCCIAYLLQVLLVMGI